MKHPQPMREVTAGGVKFGTWLRATQAMLLTRVRGIALAVGFQSTDGKKWIAFALETDKQHYRDILDSHAHAIIGEFQSEKAAMKAAEAYAAKWKAGKIRKAEDCECVEIVTPPKPTGKKLTAKAIKRMMEKAAPRMAENHRKMKARTRRRRP